MNMSAEPTGMDCWYAVLCIIGAYILGIFNWVGFNGIPFIYRPHYDPDMYVFMLFPVTFWILPAWYTYFLLKNRPLCTSILFPAAVFNFYVPFKLILLYTGLLDSLY